MLDVLLELPYYSHFSYKVSSSFKSMPVPKLTAHCMYGKSVFEMCSRWWRLYFTDCLGGHSGKERKQMLLGPNGNI